MIDGRCERKVVWEKRMGERGVGQGSMEIYSGHGVSWDGM